jgi:hypothetical protein
LPTETYSILEGRYLEAMFLEGGFESRYAIPEYDPVPDVLAVRGLNRPEQLHNDFVRLVAARDASLRPAYLTGGALYLGDDIGTDVSAEVYDYQDSITVTRDDSDGIIYFDKDIPLQALPDFTFDKAEGWLGLNPIGPGDVQAITVARRTRIELAKWTCKDALTVYFTTNMCGSLRTEAVLFQVQAALLIPDTPPSYGRSAAFTDWPSRGPVGGVRSFDDEKTQAVVDAILQHVSHIANKIAPR